MSAFGMKDVAVFGGLAAFGLFSMWASVRLAALRAEADAMENRDAATALNRRISLSWAMLVAVPLAFLLTPRSEYGLDWPRLGELGPTGALAVIVSIAAAALLFHAAQPPAARTNRLYAEGALYGLSTLANVWLIPAELSAVGAPWWAYSFAAFTGFVLQFTAMDAARNARQEALRPQTSNP